MNDITMPNIETVREMIERYSNWGRWGDEDERGTLNFIGSGEVTRAASLARKGKVFSLALPFGSSGPQTGGYGRFNPIHLMTRDGNDALANTTPRDFYGGRDGYIRSADDIVIMPLQSGTQWDGLSHIFFEGRMYNGYVADLVSSKGALKNSITKLSDRLVGRGVLLDIAEFKGLEWLEPGTPISDSDLSECASSQGVSIGRGDIVLVRTGQIGMVRQANQGWGQYAGGTAPGLALSAVGWMHSHEIAAVATDTWGMEVLPNETADVFQPVHIVAVVYMGLTVGEIFDLEELAAHCKEDGIYEFFFTAPPLPIENAVGSPINPLAIK